MRSAGRLNPPHSIGGPECLAFHPGGEGSRAARIVGDQLQQGHVRRVARTMIEADRKNHWLGLIRGRIGDVLLGGLIPDNLVPDLPGLVRRGLPRCQANLARIRGLRGLVQRVVTLARRVVEAAHPVQVHTPGTERRLHPVHRRRCREIGVVPEQVVIGKLFHHRHRIGCAAGHLADLAAVGAGVGHVPVDVVSVTGVSAMRIGHHRLVKAARRVAARVSKTSPLREPTDHVLVERAASGQRRKTRVAVGLVRAAGIEHLGRGIRIVGKGGNAVRQPVCEEYDYVEFGRDVRIRLHIGAQDHLREIQRFRGSGIGAIREIADVLEHVAGQFELVVRR